MLRSLSASVTGLLAAVLLPLSLLSIWVDGVVTDTDTYVETVTPLADDEVVQAAAVQLLQREALQLVANRIGRLSPAVKKLVGVVVQDAVGSPAFRTAWAEANRSAHEQLVAVLEDPSSAVLDQDGRVSIQLGTVLGTIGQSLAARGLVDADQLPEIDASFPVMDADQLARARRGYDALNTLRFWLPVFWLVALGLTLLLARRRLSATAKLAVASLVGLGVLALALLFARDAVTADLPQRDVALAVWDVVVSSLWHDLEAGAVVLAVMAVSAGVIAAIRSRRHPSSGSAPDGDLLYD